MQKIIIVASGFVIAAMSVVGAAETKTEPKSETPATETQKPTGPAVPIDLGPIHNGFKIGRKIISGSCPVGDAGFAALQKQGVKTIVTVDGAQPDAELAAKYGIRYVHIPVEYSGITREQGLAVARAVRDLEGPVFVHCHHGIHRGPTAAVIAAMVDEGWTNEEALGAMKQAGTGNQYTGLWAAVREWKIPTSEELNEADHSFPSAAKLPKLAATMVTIDERWDGLGAAQKAGWKAPDEHPDLDAPHEALLLSEAFRELLRTPEVQKKSADFQEKMSKAESAATALEAALRNSDAEKTQVAFKEVGQSCQNCHAIYRNPNALKAQ